MQTTRRNFLGSLVYPAAAACAFPTLAPAATKAIAAELASAAGTPEDLAKNEDYWAPIVRAFTIDASVINLNNGGVSPSPAVVQEAMRRHLEFSNSMPPPISLWQILEPQKEGIRDRLAREWGVDAEEIAITRNASESLEICQLGFDLARGDEVLACTQDYPRMLTAFRQRTRRDGVVLKLLKLPVPAEDPAEVVRIYKENITDKTRLILVSHMINLTGQILPVREIVALGRRGAGRGPIPVIVDGAHSFAHFAFKLPDLDCDYFGSSLHKWLFAPHGTGLLYVRRSKIAELWPLFAAEEKQTEDIRKFEEIGTHPAANFVAIGEALTFNQTIGFARKEARLRLLRDYWASRLLAHPSGRVRLHTSLKPAFSCGIANVQVEGIRSVALSEWLWERKRILTTAIEHEQFEGLRITPSVYTTMEQLDRFCACVEQAIERGIPKTEVS
jgi:selenocysteine lyase/cysteine desulfurase